MITFILNKLFGWDYVIWENSCTYGVSRVRIDGDGVPYFRYFGAIYLDGRSHYKITWLTCPRAKYTTKEVI